MKKLFVAATRKDDGKSTISLGLLQILQERFPRVGFIKPVGQHYVEADGHRVDEDVVLMRDICHLSDRVTDMNPVVIGRGFTENYINGADPISYPERILESFERIADGKDLVLIEGTGHAGVGAVVDLSNASVAHLLGASVLLVTTGGVGKPIDELVINKALFDAEHVPILGAVINKVLPAKYDKISRVTRQGLARKHIMLHGCVPYRESLTYPTMSQIERAVRGSLLYGEKHRENQVREIVVTAMEPYHALEHFGPRSLVIVPGDREDMILVVLAGNYVMKQRLDIAGIVLTGGILPHKEVQALLKSNPFPVLLSEDDTYTTARRIHERRVKIRSCDHTKVQETRDLVRSYIDVEALLDAL